MKTRWEIRSADKVAYYTLFMIISFKIIWLINSFCTHHLCLLDLSFIVSSPAFLKTLTEHLISELLKTASDMDWIRGLPQDLSTPQLYLNATLHPCPLASSTCCFAHLESSAASRSFTSLLIETREDASPRVLDCKEHLRAWLITWTMMTSSYCRQAA